jgi:hypothetical protein
VCVCVCVCVCVTCAALQGITCTDHSALCSKLDFDYRLIVHLVISPWAFNYMDMSLEGAGLAKCLADGFASGPANRKSMPAPSQLTTHTASRQDFWQTQRTLELKQDGIKRRDFKDKQNRKRKKSAVCVMGRYTQRQAGGRRVALENALV